MGDRERDAAAALIDARSALPDRLDAAQAKDLLEAMAVGKRPIRRVLTAADHGIPLPLVLAALPRDEVIGRAQAVLVSA
jgi:hypothetical protein